MARMYLIHLPVHAMPIACSSRLNIQGHNDLSGFLINSKLLKLRSSFMWKAKLFCEPSVYLDSSSAVPDTTHLVGESEGRGGVAGTIQVVGLKARQHKLTLFPAGLRLQPTRGHYRPQGGYLWEDKDL